MSRPDGGPILKDLRFITLSQMTIRPIQFIGAIFGYITLIPWIHFQKFVDSVSLNSASVPIVSVEQQKTELLGPPYKDR